LLTDLVILMKPVSSHSFVSRQNWSSDNGTGAPLGYTPIGNLIR
jgi:hypothetical protein